MKFVCCVWCCGWVFGLDWEEGFIILFVWFVIEFGWIISVIMFMGLYL